MRVRLAAALAVFYAFCVVVPSVAIALTDGGMAANCLIRDHFYTKTHVQKAEHAHVHADAAGHKHHDHGMAGHKHHDHGMAVQDEDQSQPPQHSDHDKFANCCGLFCFNVVATFSGLHVHEPIGALAMTLSDDANLTGRGPERLIRPPIALQVA